MDFGNPGALARDRPRPTRTVGGGLEYAVGYGWSVKGEFLYVKFDNYNTFTTGPFNSLNIRPREVKVEDYIWRAGMNYKFW
jgi:opacity protein-like surface antigen